MLAGACRWVQLWGGCRTICFLKKFLPLALVSSFRRVFPTWAHLSLSFSLSLPLCLSFTLFFSSLFLLFSSLVFFSVARHRLHSTPLSFVAIPSAITSPVACSSTCWFVRHLPSLLREHVKYSFVVALTLLQSNNRIGWQSFLGWWARRRWRRRMRMRIEGKGKKGKRRREGRRGWMLSDCQDYS